MGIRGPPLDLIRNYLSNRCQFVKIDNVESQRSRIMSGVPQGSNLGPLLFNMMLYDLKYVETPSIILKYADDIVMLMTCDELSDLEEKIRNDINEVKSYYIQNGLELNLRKSKYMTFGFEALEVLDDFMSSNGIQKADTIRYLGVTLDNKLRLNEHADHLVNKLSQSVNALSIIKHHLPNDSLMQFYNAFVGSHIFYTGFMLCRLSAENINRLQRIQNRALKTVFNLERRFSTSELFTKVAVNVLPIIGIAYFNLLLLVKKHLLDTEESQKDFEVIQEGRRIQQLKFQRYRKNVLASDFLCLGPTIYNQLPLEIREISKYNLFKRKLKTYLLERKINFLRGNALNVNRIFEIDA